MLKLSSIKSKCQLKSNWHLNLLEMYMNLICTWDLIEKLKFNWGLWTFFENFTQSTQKTTEFVIN
jgi:hypothetical protein